jgi:hypothetical protein
VQGSVDATTGGQPDENTVATVESLWIGKGAPRAWLAPGERISLTNATTAWGRLSYSIVASKAIAGQYNVRIELSDRFKSAPPAGGIVLRIRAPGYPQQQIKSATAAGEPVAASQINGTEETVRFPMLVLSDLEQIVVTVK